MLDVASTEAFVKAELHSLGPDGSHDWWHIHRVRSMALSLAQQEGLQASSLELVEHAALLHDVADWKYAGSTERPAVQDFLEAQGVQPDKKDAILQIIAGVGFKDELGSAARLITPEMAVVQDADRLDAMGAIGIARCFTFGGRFGRVLHDPTVPPRAGLTRQQYMDAGFQQTTLNHFHEKLLLLKGMMKTEAGRRMAQRRHAVMEQFLRDFLQEWDAAA